VFKKVGPVNLVLYITAMPKERMIIGVDRICTVIMETAAPTVLATN